MISWVIMATVCQQLDLILVLLVPFAIWTRFGTVVCSISDSHEGWMTTSAAAECHPISTADGSRRASDPRRRARACPGPPPPLLGAACAFLGPLQPGKRARNPRPARHTFGDGSGLLQIAPDLRPLLSLVSFFSQLPLVFPPRNHLENLPWKSGGRQHARLCLYLLVF